MWMCLCYLVCDQGQHVTRKIGTTFYSFLFKCNNFSTVMGFRRFPSFCKQTCNKIRSPQHLRGGGSIEFRCPLYSESHTKPANHFLNQSRGTAGLRGFEHHHIRHQHKPWYALHKNLPGLLDIERHITNICIILHLSESASVIFFFCYSTEQLFNPLLVPSMETLGQALSTWRLWFAL